jgi:ribulose-phosphate 3-epimerase
MDNVGLSLNPDIALSELDGYLNKISEVLIMSVYAGFGGQQFIESSLERIETIKNKREQMGADYKIAVDGGVNPEVAARCAESGADEVIVGSYITASDDPAGAVDKIRAEVLGVS